MISTSERLKRLKEFMPIHVGKMKFLDKMYNITFHPSLGLFQIIPVDGRVGPASFAISIDSLTNGEFSPVSKRDKAELLASKAKAAWGVMTSKKKREITDKMPLNSLYLGGDTIY